MFVPATNCDDKALILIEGEIGSGKSTTASHIMYAHCQDKGIEDHKPYMFKYGRQCERVTTCVQSKEVEDIRVVDTPGTNDF